MFRPCAILFLVAAFAASAGRAQDRFALVIGNGKYDGSSALKNPPNDAAAVASALERLDFQVTRKTDTDLVTLERAVLAFRKSLTKKCIALFFYAGHGMQVKGENFLVPVDADVQEETQVKRKCYPIEELLNEFDSSNAALKIVILDSCRDNPLTRSWSRSASGGLASIAQVPDGTIIAFSTAPGKTALDGRGDNSPFTKHLVATLERRPTEGLELIDALRATGQAVSKEIGQRPWLNFDTSLEDFYLWRDGKSSVVSGRKPLSIPPADEPETYPVRLNRVDHPHDSKFNCVENSLGMKFVVVPSGEFFMGSPAHDTQSEDDEKPQHRVRISRAFYLGMHEVTLGQFLKFYHGAPYKTEAEKNGKGGWGLDASGEFKQGTAFVPWVTGFAQTMDHPVVNVSWNDAKAFCKWLSAKEGHTYRLPTEAEWEYACRGGTTTRYFTGNDPETLVKYANVADGTAKAKWTDWTTIQGHDGFAFSAPVGSFRPNPFGLYDMHGNVSERCEDWYGEKEYAPRSGGATDPKGPAAAQANASGRIVRGGAWGNLPNVVRSAFRDREFEGMQLHAVGFRVVLIRNQ